MVTPGSTIPDVVVHDGEQFPSVEVKVKDLCKGKKVVIMGLPGAFTPC